MKQKELTAMVYVEEHKLSKGREEGRTLVARNLREMGIDVVDIQKATGLTPKKTER